jgi:hypothetical protein
MNFTTPMQKKNKQNVNVFCSIVSQSLRKRRMIDVKFSKQIQTNEHAGQMNINSWVSGKKYMLLVLHLNVYRANPPHQKKRTDE